MGTSQMANTRRFAPLAAFVVGSLAVSLLLFGSDRVSLSGAAGSSAGKGPNLTTLPLGDGKAITTGARRGYLFLCRPQAGGPGAVHGRALDPREHLRPHREVHGGRQRRLADGDLHAKVKGQAAAERNGLPKHNTGTFPMRPPTTPTR